MAQQTRGGTATSTATVTRILLVDDDPIVARSLAGLLEHDGYEVANSPTVAEAMQLLRGSVFSVVIADVAPPDRDGFELLRHVRTNYPDVPVILLTNYGSIEAAIEAVKRGAFDYLTKPLTHDEIAHAVGRALGSGARSSRAANPAEGGERPERAALPTIIGQDYRTLKVLEMALTVAASQTTVLITGESGTGKSMIARAIHGHSPRHEGAFVEVACGAIPDTLLESELFGHVRGAFTHALSDKPGKFAVADGGTIFLDEVATASPQLQVKLLRVLQERRFEPVGSNQTLQVDVRVIVATNHDLWQEVEAGRFRRDLYYRVNVVNIELPPLRDRAGDIRMLAEHFLARFQAGSGRGVLGISPEAMELMRGYRWPGNIRELENCVQRAVVLCKGPYVRPEDLPPAIVNRAATDRPASAGRTLREALAEPERRIILAALDSNKGNRQAAASQLGINRSTLFKKMRRYGLLDFRPGSHG